MNYRTTMLLAAGLMMGVAGVAQAAETSKAGDIPTAPNSKTPYEQGTSGANHTGGAMNNGGSMTTGSGTMSRDSTTTPAGDAQEKANDEPTKQYGKPDKH